METLPVIPWPVILKVLFLLTVIGHVIYGAILFYHLQNYSLDRRVTALTYTFFITATVPLLLIMLGALFYI
jgi:hypothetical protein